jgi:hypothetical protein
MQTSTTAARAVARRLTATAVLAVTLGAGSGGAETFTRGGSTASIEQSGGGAESRSLVVCAPDGQRILTHDGSSTDILIQDSTGWLWPGSDAPRAGPGDRSPVPDCFGRQSLSKRFSRRQGDTRDWFTGLDAEASGARTEFRQRMLERLRSRF